MLTSLSMIHPPGAPHPSEDLLKRSAPFRSPGLSLLQASEASLLYTSILGRHYKLTNEPLPYFLCLCLAFLFFKIMWASSLNSYEIKTQTNQLHKVSAKASGFITVINIHGRQPWRRPCRPPRCSSGSDHIVRTVRARWWGRRWAGRGWSNRGAEPSSLGVYSFF